VQEQINAANFTIAASRPPLRPAPLAQTRGVTSNGWVETRGPYLIEPKSSSRVRMREACQKAARALAMGLPVSASTAAWRGTVAPPRKVSRRTTHGMCPEGDRFVGTALGGREGAERLRQKRIIAGGGGSPAVAPRSGFAAAVSRRCGGTEAALRTKVQSQYYCRRRAALRLEISGEI